MSQQNFSASQGEDGVGIPRIIHQIWYQGAAQLPEKYRRFRRSWQKNHPDWEFVLWDEKSIREHIHSEYAWFAAYFDGYPMDIQRMDAARYFILNTFGGFYIDMDVESFKPIDELLDGYRLLLSKTAAYNNAIIGSVPRHPLWQTVFDNLCEFCEQHASGSPRQSTALLEAVSTGPRFFSRTVEEGGFDRQPTTRVCPGSFFEPDFPREEGGRMVRSGDLSQSYARHHGDLRWLSLGHRLLSNISAQVFKIYWFIQSKKKP